MHNKQILYVEKLKIFVCFEYKLTLRQKKIMFKQQIKQFLKKIRVLK